MASNLQNRTESGNNKAGFSLVEILVTVAIVALLIGLSVTGIGSVLRSTRLDQAGRTIVDEINVARQIAVSRNLNVELRFIETPREDDSSGDPIFHALQSWLVDKDGASKPITRLVHLPPGIILASEPELSSIIGNLPKTTDESSNDSHVSILIRPSGMIQPRTGLPLSEPWFVTTIHERNEGADIDDEFDFITVQIDPWTSRPEIHRP